MHWTFLHTNFIITAFPGGPEVKGPLFSFLFKDMNFTGPFGQTGHIEILHDFYGAKANSILAFIGKGIFQNFLASFISRDGKFMQDNIILVRTSLHGTTRMGNFHLLCLFPIMKFPLENFH
jgi:hypothetical protein